MVDTTCLVAIVVDCTVGIGATVVGWRVGGILIVTGPVDIGLLIGVGDADNPVVVVVVRGIVEAEIGCEVVNGSDVTEGTVVAKPIPPVEVVVMGTMGRLGLFMSTVSCC